LMKLKVKDAKTTSALRSISRQSEEARRKKAHVSCRMSF
jgi:hypothetical protein